VSDGYDRGMAWQLRSVIPVWVIALAGAVVVGVLAPKTSSPGAYLTWLPIVLAGSVLITFAIQLALQRKEGLVTRLMASLGGALIILAVATAVLALAG
jgi:hypothetical protein